MSAAKIAKLVALAGLYIPLAAHAETFGGPDNDVLVILGAPPLWIRGDYSDTPAFTIDKNSMSIVLDGKNACPGSDPDADTGWICKLEGMKPGKHVVAVTFNDLRGQHHSLGATLVLRAKDKKIEVPAMPLNGEQFWCVAITLTQVKLMPKSDERCQTN